jgi:hypothetical protein
MINDGGPMETDTERRREALVPLSLLGASLLVLSSACPHSYGKPRWFYLPEQYTVPWHSRLGAMVIVSPTPFFPA